MDEDKMLYSIYLEIRKYQKMQLLKRRMIAKRPKKEATK